MAAPVKMYTQDDLRNRQWMIHPVYFPEAKLAPSFTTAPPNSPADSVVAADLEVDSIMSKDRRRIGSQSVHRLLNDAKARLSCKGKWQAVNAAARHFFSITGAAAKCGEVMAQLAAADSSSQAADNEVDHGSSNDSSGGSYYSSEYSPVNIQRTAEWVAVNPYNITF